MISSSPLSLLALIHIVSIHTPVTTKHTCQHLIKSTGLLCHRKAEVYNYKSTMLAWDQIEEKWNQHGSSLNLGPFADEVEWGGDGRSGWEATSRLGGETHLQVLWLCSIMLISLNGDCLIGHLRGEGHLLYSKGLRWKSLLHKIQKVCQLWKFNRSTSTTNQPMLLSH